MDLDDFTSPFTHNFLFRLRRYIRHSRPCFIRYPNISNFVIDSPLKHRESCSIYYLQHSFPSQGSTQTAQSGIERTNHEATTPPNKFADNKNQVTTHLVIQHALQRENTFRVIKYSPDSYVCNRSQ